MESVVHIVLAIIGAAGGVATAWMVGVTQRLSERVQALEEWRDSSTPKRRR